MAPRGVQCMTGRQAGECSDTVLRETGESIECSAGYRAVPDGSNMDAA